MIVNLLLYFYIPKHAYELKLKKEKETWRSQHTNISKGVI